MLGVAIGVDPTARTQAQDLAAIGHALEPTKAATRLALLELTVVAARVEVVPHLRKASVVERVVGNAEVDPAGDVFVALAVDLADEVRRLIVERVGTIGLTACGGPDEAHDKARNREPSGSAPRNWLGTTVHHVDLVYVATALIMVALIFFRERLDAQNAVVAER